MLQKAIFQHKEQLLNLYYILNILSVHVCTHICVCVCVHTEMEVGMRETVTRLCVCVHTEMEVGMREMV